MPVYGFIKEEFVQVDMEYQEAGSLRGKLHMMLPPEPATVEFGATDAELNETDRENNPDLRSFPATAG